MKKFLKVQGNYYEIGVQIGKVFTEEIKQLINERFLTISHEFKNLGYIFQKDTYYNHSDDLMKSLKNYTPNEYSELIGISDGSGVNISDIIFALGYSDIFDLLYKNYNKNKHTNYKLDGCTSFIVTSQCDSLKNTRVGQTWDLPPGTNKYTVLFQKLIDDDTEFYSFSTVLGLTHMGLNSHGICIGTTNLATTETSPGIIFPALIQLALSKSNTKEILVDFKRIPKLSGHYYYLAAKNLPAYAIEVSSENCLIEEVSEEIYIHANHYKNKEFIKNAIDYSSSSRDREHSMEKSFKQKCGNLTLIDYKNILSNHQGQICRHYQENEKIPSETCGAIIFTPIEKKFIISFNYPCENKWVEYTLKE